MELEIISPGGVLFKGETDYVSFRVRQARSTSCPITLR